MKKIIKKSAFALLLLAPITLASCGKTDAKTEDIPEQKEEQKNDVLIDLIDYGAKGDGVTSDRAIIQKAINEASSSGGGKVILTKGHTFLSGNLILKSNVELYIDDNATLLQNGDINDYVEARGWDYGNGFVKIGDPIIPYVGDSVFLPHTGEFENVWPGHEDFREVWHWNYPYIYADKGVHNVKISGGVNSQLNMAPHGPNCDGKIHSNVFGFYRVKDFELSNFRINYNGQHLMDFQCCNNGLISHLECWTKRSIGEDECHLNDGCHLDKCQDMLIEYCTFASGDDAFLLGNSYGDIRRDRWASSTDTQPMKNIEISHINCPSYCSGFDFLSLAGTCPDLEAVEMRDIYIHDCNFAGVKTWGQDTVWLPDRSMWNGIPTPIANLRWENNNPYYWPEGHMHQIKGFDFMDPNLISDCISDDPGIHSMPAIRNGDFTSGKSYWNFATENGSVATVQRYDDKSFGYIGELSKGNTKIYEGLYLDKGTYKLTAKVRNSTDTKTSLFVSDQMGNIIKKINANSTTWENFNFEFEIDVVKNYRVGLMSEDGCRQGSWAMLDDFMVTKLA